jgi:translation initiation factor 4A
MINRKALQLESLRIFCMDEADELLDRGFEEQMYEIFQFLPETTQVALFSATMPLEVLQVAEKFMRDPVRILVKREQLTLEGIRQYYVALDDERFKLDTLCDLYETLTIVQAIIYCNKRRQVEWLTEQMLSRDFTVSAIHGKASKPTCSSHVSCAMFMQAFSMHTSAFPGDMDQRERDLVMNEFRTGSSRVLISTDLLARGIDIQQVPCPEREHSYPY